MFGGLFILACRGQPCSLDCFALENNGYFDSVSQILQQTRPLLAVAAVAICSRPVIIGEDAICERSAFGTRWALPNAVKKGRTLGEEEEDVPYPWQPEGRPV